MSDGFEYYCIDALQHSEKEEIVCACAHYLHAQGMRQISETFPKTRQLRCAEPEMFASENQPTNPPL